MSKFSLIYLGLSGVIVAAALSVHVDARGTAEGPGLFFNSSGGLTNATPVFSPSQG